MKNLYIFLSFTLFLLSSFLFSTASCGGIATQSAFLYPYNAYKASCPNGKSGDEDLYIFDNDCKPLLTFEVQFDNPVDSGDFLILLGAVKANSEFTLVHLAPVNEPFISPDPKKGANQDYFDPTPIDTSSNFGRLGDASSIKENLNGITHRMKKPLLPGIFYRAVYQLVGGNNDKAGLFCLGLQTLTKNMQLIDSNECIYPFKDKLEVFTSALDAKEIIAMEPSDAVWEKALDSSKTNKISLVLLFSTVGWQLGNLVEFKFPSAFTIDPTLDDAKIKLSVTTDVSAATPTWLDFDKTKVILQRTPEGFYRFLLPAFTHAHKDLKVSSDTLFDPANAKGAFKFQFLLENKGPDYVNFEAAIFRVIVPDTNKIIMAGPIKWASGTHEINYAADSIGTSGTLKLFWGLAPGAATGLTGNDNTLCPINIMITKKDSQIYWNSFTFTFDISTFIRSFSYRGNLALLVKDKATRTDASSAVLLNSVKHNLPVIGLTTLEPQPATDYYIKISKIGHIPKNTYFVAFKAYLFDDSKSTTLGFTIEISEGTSSSPIVVKKLTFSAAPATVPVTGIFDKATKIRGLGAFTYPDNPNGSELKGDRSAALNADAYKTKYLPLVSNVEKKSFATPLVRFSVDSPSSFTIDSFLIPISYDLGADGKGKIVRLLVTFNPRLFLINEPLKGVYLVGVIFASFDAIAGTVAAFKGFDYGSDANPLATATTLRLNTIYIPTDGSYATVSIVCIPTDANGAECNKATEYTAGKAISGIALYKSKINNYPTPYADSKVFDFIVCIATAAYAATPDTTTTFALVTDAVLAFNSYVITGIGAGGVSQVAAPYFVDETKALLTEDYQKYFYLRLEGSFNTPVFSPSKVAFFSYDIGSWSLSGTPLQKLIDFQEGTMVSAQQTLGVTLTNKAGSSLYQLQATASLEQYEHWMVESSFSFDKKGMINKVNVYQPLAVTPNLVPLTSVKTLNLVVYDDKNVYAVYRILGSVLPNSQLTWKKDTDSLTMEAKAGYCGGTDQDSTRTSGILDYENLVTRPSLDVTIRTGLGPACDVRSGNKGVKRGAAFVIMTQYDVIDRNAPITWDHGDVNRDNKCLFHEITATNKPSFYYVLCQADSYPDADFGSPNKYLRLRLKPLDPTIFKSNSPNILNYVWSNADGKRVYQLFDVSIPDAGSPTLDKWVPTTCAADMEVKWGKISSVANTKFTLVPGSFPLNIKNKRRYVLKPVITPYIGQQDSVFSSSRKLRVSLTLPAPYNAIKGCKHDTLTCVVIIPGDITTAFFIELANYSGQDIPIEVEKLVITLIYYGTVDKTDAEKSDYVTTAVTADLAKFEIYAKNDANTPLKQEQCTIRIKNTEVTTFTTAGAVTAKDLKLIPTVNSLSTFSVTITSTLPILPDFSIALVFANGVLPKSYKFFRIACSAYDLTGKPEPRVYAAPNTDTEIIFKVNTAVDKLSFVATCEKIPFSFLSTTTDILYNVKVKQSNGDVLYPEMTAPAKVAATSEVTFKKPVALKKVLSGVGYDADYIFTFALNAGLAVTNAGRILVLFTHINPARLNNDGRVDCSVNKVPTTCAFLEDYLLSVTLPAALLSAPATSTLPPPLNELVVSGVKQGNYFDKPEIGDNFMEFRQNDRIYFAVDADANHQNGVLTHDYIKDPIIPKKESRLPIKLLNIRSIDVSPVDERGRVAIKVRFLKNFAPGESLAVALPKNLRDSNLTAAGLNVELNRELSVPDSLFIKNAYMLKKGVLKIDILDDLATNPLYQSAADKGFGLTYDPADPKTFTLYELTFSIDLNLFSVAKKFVLTKDRFEFYVLDSITNVILESSSPEINFVEQKPNALAKPAASPTDGPVKFKLSDADTTGNNFVQIVHKASGKCLKRRKVSDTEHRLDLVNCDTGYVAGSSPNVDLGLTLFQLGATDTLPASGTAVTIGDGQAHAVLLSKEGDKTYKLGADPAPKFAVIPLVSPATNANFRITYTRDITNYNNIPVFSLCQSFEVTAAPLSTWKVADALCLNVVVSTTANTPSTFTYAPLNAASKANQLFSFRNVKLNPAKVEEKINVEQKIDFQADFVVIEWKITAAQSTTLYFSVQGANADVAVSKTCNSRYPDISPFPFVQARNEFGIPIVRFRAPILKLKSCGFVEAGTGSPNLVGKVGYYTDPYSQASGKFSLVTFKLDSITTERVTKVDNPDSHNWYFRNTISPLALNIGSELTFYDSNKLERLLYTLPAASTTTVGSLKLKAFEKYTVSKFSVFLINLDNPGTGADGDTFLVPTTLVASTPNLYTFTLTLKNVISGKYRMIVKYVVKPATTSKRILAEDVPLKNVGLDKSELEKYTSVNIDIKGNEENSSVALRFIGLLVVLVMIAMN